MIEAKVSGITVKIERDKTSVFRERKLTKAERKLDPDGKVMVDVVNITFGKGEPKVVVSRDVCS